MTISDDEDSSWPPRFPNRGWENDPRRVEAHQQLIDLHIKHLAEYELATRPVAGEDLAPKKDDYAFKALADAARFIDVLAGWAVNHTVGLGIAGLSFVPRGPSQARGETYIAEKAKVDRHEHEAAGAVMEGEYFSSPTEARRAARNLIHALSCSRTMCTALQPLKDALDALEYGETLPILAPAGSGQKREYRAARLQLRALGLVAYREKIGGSKKNAQDEVAEAYRVSSSTLRTWEYRARKNPNIGQLEVTRTIGFAHNAASWIVATRQGKENNPHMVEHSEEGYGRAALEKAAQEYRDVLADIASKSGHL